MERMLSKYEWIDRFSLFVFDLDNTLYDEKTYLFSGYRKIADLLSIGGEDSRANEYYEYLIDEFNQNGRHNLFDKFIARFNLSVTMEKLLDILHNQQVCIQLDEQAKELLDLLMVKNKKVYILTNGNVNQQKNKIKLLRIEETYPLFNIVYASQLAPKPSPISLEYIMKQEGITSKKVILIGDSKIDEETAKNADTNYLSIHNI